MNEQKTKSIAKRIACKIKKNADSTAEHAELFRAIGAELGLSHHLRPKCVAAVMDKPKLPDIAPELFVQRSDSKEKIIPFLRRVYAPWLDQGFTRNHLSALDKQAYVAFKNHLYYHGDTGGLDFPTIDAQIDRDFALLTGFDDDASKRELENEIFALRRIHHLLKSRTSKNESQP